MFRDGFFISWRKNSQTSLVLLKIKIQRHIFALWRSLRSNERAIQSTLYIKSSCIIRSYPMWGTQTAPPCRKPWYYNKTVTLFLQALWGSNLDLFDSILDHFWWISEASHPFLMPCKMKSILIEQWSVTCLNYNHIQYSTSSRSCRGKRQFHIEYDRNFWKLAMMTFSTRAFL